MGAILYEAIFHIKWHFNGKYLLGINSLVKKISPKMDIQHVSLALAYTKSCMNFEIPNSHADIRRINDDQT